MKAQKIPAAIIIATLSIGANIVLGMMLLAEPNVPVIAPSETAIPDFSQEEISKYPLLSKRIFMENQNDILVNFIPLRAALREYTAKLPDPIGIYFEYLPSGTSIGINDNMEINIASLVKIPVVMGVYKEIERGKVKKDELLTLKNENIDRRFGDFWKKGEGTAITVMETINLALINSDNTALNMLLSVSPGKNIDRVFDSLDIPKNINGDFHVISPKNYSSILRSLYLSSYLKKESSDEILETLSKTIFNDKIAAGIPEGINISHKIGIFNSKNNSEKTFSDCGIIYAPDRPYLLCIMVKSNEEKAREYMSHISKMIYGYVTAVKEDK
jgi:beta-lactamase class A